MKKLFTDTKITWKFLIIFSFVLAIGVGILNRIPMLNNTSFQDISIVFDMWIILAIFIIMNCKSAKEAVIKCFIFFLISQPVIYFTEVVIDAIFYKKEFINELVLYFKNYYFGAGWFRWTLLTIPGSFIAYQVKKNNIISALILSVATGYLSFMGSKGLVHTLLNNFPRHLLNSVICLFMSFSLIFVLLKNKKERIVSLIITIICLVLGIAFSIRTYYKPVQETKIIDFDKEIKITDVSVNDPSIINAQYEVDGNFLVISNSEKVGSTKIILTTDKEEKIIYDINITNKKLTLKKTSSD